jgi:hypothetical protein
MRRANTVQGWSVVVCILLASTACGSKQVILKGHENDEKRDADDAKGLAIGTGEPATTGAPNPPSPAPDSEQKPESEPKSDAVADVEVLFDGEPAAKARIDLCKLPDSAYALLGWGAPTGQGGHEAQEIIKDCGFTSKYATCAFGLDPTTNAIAVLGCEAYAGPDPLNHTVCIQAAAARTQAEKGGDVSQYQCIRSDLFGQADSQPATLLADDDTNGSTGARE